MARILVVDDEEDLLDLLTYNLETSGFEVERATTGRAALDLAQRRKIDLVVLDVRDNGIGMAGKKGNGRGLVNMRTRAEEIGGGDEEADVEIGGRRHHLLDGRPLGEVGRNRPYLDPVPPRAPSRFSRT